jgi:hypothetical protein
MKYLVIIALGLAIAGGSGCDSPRKRKLLKGANCGQAIGNALRVPLEAEGRDLAGMSDVQRERLAMVTIAMMERCQNDRWSTEAIECMAGADVPADLGTCKGTLTAEQERTSKEAVDRVTAGAWSPEIPATE